MIKETSSKKVLVVDGHSWMHRAFHAMQVPMTAPDGKPTNAVFGFFSILSKTLTFLQPDALVVAFDDGRPTARIEALAQYKIKRPPTDPDLKAQFPIVKELLAAMHVPVACEPNVEGDDILGTLARQGEQAGLQVYLATSDRDAYQLISESTRVISQGRGAEGPRIIGPVEVKDRYGVSPRQMIDFLGLKGDASDNIPGVPGVGEKTAAKLLAEHGTLEAVLEAASEGRITGKVGQNLNAHVNCAKISQQVATIICDIPLDIDLQALSFGEYTSSDIRNAFMHYALRSPLTWMIKFGKHDAAVDDASSDDTSLGTDTQTTHVLPEADAQLKETFQASRVNSPYKGVIIARAGETLFDNDQILAVAPADNTEPNDDAADITQASSILKELAQLLQSEQKIAAPDLKALFTQVLETDYTTEPVPDPACLSSENDFDLSVAAYLLASYKSDFSLKQLAFEYAGIELDELTGAGSAENNPANLDDAATRAAAEAALVAELAGILEQRLQDEELLELYHSIELPLIPVLARMEHAGITVDIDRLAELAQYGRERIESLR
ncbi:MAG: DNA polymerase I, partial [Coriobacteriia bacterium]|nr:DNA polymerase I [Coriobacteriia bacterium]